MSATVLRRVVRRETHSPRTVATVIVLLLAALAAIYTGIEVVLHLLGLGPLMVAPGAALAWLTTLPDEVTQAAVVAGGAVVAAIGVVLVWLAVGPGRRPKHELSVSAHAVVVDNGVIASAVAERVRRELDLSQASVVVGIGHRSADVTVRPDPGQSIDKARLREIAEAELARYDLSPRVRVHARVVSAADTGGVS